MTSAAATAITGHIIHAEEQSQKGVILRGRLFIDCRVRVTYPYPDYSIEPSSCGTHHDQHVHVSAPLAERLVSTDVERIPHRYLYDGGEEGVKVDIERNSVESVGCHKVRVRIRNDIDQD